MKVGLPVLILIAATVRVAPVTAQKRRDGPRAGGVPPDCVGRRVGGGDRRDSHPHGS